MCFIVAFLLNVFLIIKLMINAFRKMYAFYSNPHNLGSAFVPASSSEGNKTKCEHERFILSSSIRISLSVTLPTSTVN